MWEQFRNPPIVEAILSFRVEPSAASPSGALDRFSSCIQARFAGSELGAPGRFEGEPVREYRSADARVQVRVTGSELTVHGFRPYPGWNTLSADAEWIWQAYSEAFEPRLVTRLGLRYINRIEIPLPHERIDDYLRLFPAVDWPLTGYLARMTIPDLRSGATGLLTIAFEPNPGADAVTAPFVLDLEVWRQGKFELSERFIWGTFRQLREFHNRLFFESLTEQVKEQFR
jgi:uncharacterized protein (TIGR04255 family)